MGKSEGTETTAKRIRRATKERSEVADKIDITRERRTYTTEELIPTGSTMLNLACSDNPNGAFIRGSVVTLPGTSQAGKTMVVWDMFACCLRTVHLVEAEYQNYYDDVEHALDMDINYLFGEETANSVFTPPLGCSNTVQDFKANILTLAKAGKPFIYALDSLDALTSDQELEKEFKRALAAARSEEEAKKIAGSFGMEKAKSMHELLRMMKSEVEKSGSLLVIVQQLKQNTQATSPWSPKSVTTGGEAPFYYSSHQIWLSKGQSDPKLKQRGRRIGSPTVAKVTKNKITGKLREVYFNIYYDYGLDDITSCVDFMIDEGMWKKEKGQITILDFDMSFSNKDDIVTAIEQNKWQKRMKRIVGDAWNEIEESIRVNRLQKYD